MAAYTTIDNPELYFQTKLYTGTGTDGETITLDGDTDMLPTFIWIKDRGNNSTSHHLIDSERGGTRNLMSDNTGAEQSDSMITAFNADGFDLGTYSEVNTDDNTYVAWCWKAGTQSSNDASATGVGSIDSNISVSTDAGFSITTYTGIGSAGTIAHALSAVPKLIIYKKRNDTSNWFVYHAFVEEDDRLKLNTNVAAASSNFMNNTAPTSSVFSVHGEGALNESGGTFLTYLFSEKQGFSKFGSYTGNGNADGTFVFLGFKPAFVLIKKSNSTGTSWIIFDNKRLGYNGSNYTLAPDSTNDAATGDNGAIDLLSNGFKCRDTDSGANASGDTYIYMAFAEAPFVNSKGVPCNAR